MNENVSVKLTLSGVEHSLALDMNATIALAVATGIELKALLTSLAKPETPVVEKLKAVRLVVWAMMASENPDFEDNPKETLRMVGSWLQLDDIERVAEAVAELQRKREGVKAKSAETESKGE